jgi:hypothetical protein
VVRHSARLAAVALVAVALGGVSARAANYPPAFPREGAKKVLDNDKVTVWDVTWEKGKATPLHELGLDQVSVTVADGVVKTTRADKSATVDLSRLGAVRMEPKGTIVSEEGISERPRRAIVVQIKPYSAAKLDPKLAEGLKEARGKQIPGQFPREGSIKLFEDEHLVLWDDTWPINKGLGPLHAHYESVVGVFIEPGVLAPETVRKVGDVIFSAARMPPHQEEAVKGPPRAIFIQFK